MKRFTGWLRAYVARLEQRGRWSFLWRAWLHAVAISYATAAVVQLLAPAGPRVDLMGKNSWELCVLVLLIGPFSETMLFQFVPLEFARAAAMRRWLRFAVSIVPFALMHGFAGAPTVIAAGGVGGFFFALTYDRWRSESVYVAIGMTFLLHSSFNLVGALAILLAR